MTSALHGAVALARRVLPLAALLLAIGAASAHAGTTQDPIDQRWFTQFQSRSHWVQPWRSYLDTRPASVLRNAVGINFDVGPEAADATAQLLHASGFRRARVEWTWGFMSYDDQSQPRDLSPLARLRALKRHGIRPLILLNSNAGWPCPLERWDAVLALPAPAGARVVQLDPRSAAQVVPGRTGLDSADGRRAAAEIITQVAPDGTAVLSRPLPDAMSAGPHSASTLAYAPFAPPRLPDGSPNPAFEATLRGWLSYVGAVMRQARAIFGSGFDVEIWNELTFGSDFLYGDRYYDPAPRGDGDVTQELLSRTIAWLRDPANGIPASVGIGDGFTSQTPFPSGATVPAGVTALDKHPYMDHVIHFPQDQAFNGLAALDARGDVDYDEHFPTGPNDQLVRRDHFVPRYDAFLPEYWLTAIQTESLVRDLAPFTTKVYDTVEHGRNTHPPGSPPPAMWITETGLGTDTAGIPLSPAQAERMHAISTLRGLLAWVSKGVTAIHFFAASGENWGLVDPRFIEAARSGGYPGDDAGGLTMTGMRRMMQAFQGPASFSRTRPLSLLSISDNHDHRQFEGDGTPRHPPLYDRDVLAFFPFQTSAKRYVAGVYVMTRNVTRPLAPEGFRLTVGGLPPGPLAATATDPLSGARSPARIVSRAGDRAVVEIEATDYPRLLTLDTSGKRPRAGTLCRKGKAKGKGKKKRRARSVARPQPRCKASRRVRQRRPAGRCRAAHRARSAPRHGARRC